MPSRPVSSGPADPVFARGFPGILGVYPSSQEVKAVFPSLSATVIPHAQEIVFRRGDSFDIDLQLQDDQDPPSNVSIANGIVRFAAKLGYFGATSSPGVIVGNEGAQIIKRTYDPLEIEVIDSANGQARIHIKKTDTLDHPLVPLMWDIEVTLPTAHLSGQPGTVTVQTGDPMVLGSGVDFEAAGVGLGDIIHVEGRHVMILDVPHPHAMRVDFTEWTGGSGLSYNLYTGSSRTVASGKWTCLGDVVR